MKEKDLVKIVSTHEIECFGLNKEKTRALNKPEKVIVKIYDNGACRALCRYRDLGASYCTLSGKEEDSERYNFRCIYVTSPWPA